MTGNARPLPTTVVMIPSGLILRTRWLLASEKNRFPALSTLRKEGVAIWAYRENLRRWLEERFGTLPEALVQRIEAIEDAQRLRAALRQVVRLNSLAELAL